MYQEAVSPSLAETEVRIPPQHETEEMYKLHRDLQKHIVLAPEKRNSRKPILRSNGTAGMVPVLWRQNTRSGGKFWTSNLSANRGRSNLDLRIVANALEL